MKQYLAFGILFLLSACGSTTSKSPDPAVLPSFDLLMMDSVTTFNTNSIAEGKPSVMLYFSPDCEHCQKETEGILKNMDSLKQVQFYFITNDPIERMLVFKKMYHLDQYSNITLGRDYKFYFPSHYKVVAPPCMIIYDKNKKMRAVLDGETSASQIISFINRI